MKGLGRILISVVVISGCSKHQSQNSEAIKVDPNAVKTVLVGDAATLEGCEDAVKSAKGQVLFKSESGVMMTDLTTGALTGSTCKATMEANTTLPLNSKESKPADEKKKEDLSTILKLIPAEEIGARTFVKNNPEHDGRGVVVAVLDTGVEINHPMLSQTSTGAPKLINAQDFSGEGKVKLASVTPSAEETIETSLGSHSVKGLNGSDYQVGIFAGSSLKYSEDVAALDDYADVAVLSYLNDGVRKVRVDTNANKDFSDDAVLQNYKDGRTFSQLGPKKLLNFAVNTSEDGSEVVLHFDDGSHGTHVAGIAAGFSNGLVGVAPGAQVISGKIGDNRLSGGSTTTASMMLAIDWAVKQKADVINLSYGIRSGSNIGKSAIDQYIDKVAKESGVLFSISAGNEGPGLLTIGTPAAADLAITNGAYVSAETAKKNYGFVNFEENTIWYFSSVGPRLDGGLKPTLLSPGSALSSVPLWGAAKHANYRGTSMASPQTTGGLALILSAAKQSGLLADRASVTRAVYDSATAVAGLELIEQGHGLMNVPSAVEMLKAMKASPTEYVVSVNNPVSPTGKGAGIFVRNALGSDNLFTVAISPLAKPASDLRTLRLSAKRDWVKTTDNLWIEGPAPKTFQVTLDYSKIQTPGIHSDLIRAIDEVTNEVAFEVPVTVIVPIAVTQENNYEVKVAQKVKVGQTVRHFFQVPAGTTSLAVELSTDGPSIWAQLLDAEGRKVAELRDAELSSPMPKLYAQANVSRGGIYEIDIVGPANIRRAANLELSVKAYSLRTAKQPQNSEGVYELEIENLFAPVKLLPKVEIAHLKKKEVLTIAGISGDVRFNVSDEDRKSLSAIEFTVETSKKLYDLMTDYPFRVFDSAGGLVLSGGLEMKSAVTLESLKDLAGTDFRLEIQGAFAQAPNKMWSVGVTERRMLAQPILLHQGTRLLFETGQFRTISVDSKGVTAPESKGLAAVQVLTLTSPEGKVIQSVELD